MLSFITCKLNWKSTVHTLYAHECLKRVEEELKGSWTLKVVKGTGLSTSVIITITTRLFRKRVTLHSKVCQSCVKTVMFKCLPHSVPLPVQLEEWENCDTMNKKKNHTIVIQLKNKSFNILYQNISQHQSWYNIHDFIELAFIYQ